MVSIPFAIVAATLAWAEGNLSRAVYYGSFAGVYSVVILLGARWYLIREHGDDIYPDVDIIPYRRRIILLWSLRAFYGLCLTAVCVIVVIFVFRGAALHIILWYVWFMTICGANLFLAPLDLDTYADWRERRKKSYQAIKIHKAAEPYQFKNKDDPKYLRELLSCSTCRFHNEEASQKGLPWCDSPLPPEILNNYCKTFEQER